MKIAMAMSGGVDSSLSAALLVEEGHEVTGVYLDCWGEPGCKVDLNRKDAMKVGLKLEIPMKVLDFRKEYREKVMDWFFKEIKKGRTPNPDVWCNKEIKFGMFFDWAVENGFDRVATGHYARVDQGRLMMSKDKKKDQTYFLSMLNREQLLKAKFPIGDWLKDEVRLEVKKRGIHVWDKKGTNGICFIGHTISFEELLKTRIEEHEGKIVDLKEKVVGKHKGVEFYTIGQRHGFQVMVETNESKPLFVVSKESESNRLVVGEKDKLLRDSFEVDGWSLFSGDCRHLSPLRFGLKAKASRTDLFVRIRHGGKLVKGKVDENKVKLKEKVFGVAPGQVAVLYRKTVGTVPTVFECLGGGVIKG
jgi:tRNA-uridine 2-sulfurtransferase